MKIPVEPSASYLNPPGEAAVHESPGHILVPPLLHGPSGPLFASITGTQQRLAEYIRVVGTIGTLRGEWFTVTCTHPRGWGITGGEVRAVRAVETIWALQELWKTLGYDDLRRVFPVSRHQIDSEALARASVFNRLREPEPKLKCSACWSN